MSVGEVALTTKYVRGSIRRRPERRCYDPDFAPMNIAFRCEAHDGIGPYTLPMLCIRTPSGWINARTRTALHVTVTGWRYP